METQTGFLSFIVGMEEDFFISFDEMNCFPLIKFLYVLISSFVKLRHVVNKLQNMSPTKRLPLVILHRSRVNSGPALQPNNKKLLESWKKAGALYVTPPGSNDDW